MYACGITVYDSSHVGHARAAVVFDVIYRYLVYKGFDVTYIRNFTDVDDKIINRAEKEGIPCSAIAERYIREYTDDMKRLNVSQPSVEPKATEHIREMLDVIKTLIDKGHAYEKDGDVFFDVASFDGYGKLSGRSLDDMKAGARIEVDTRKKNPQDFVLWKSSKPGEPEWESPWGMGRPGWHIECSAMSMKYLGKSIDIHGGGQDLIFPHHENEIAQSEAFSGEPFARFWIHNGFVTINQEKMSKSLGNFFVLHDIYTEWPPRVLRYLLISKHYHSPIDFSTEALAEAKTALERIENTLALVEQHYGENLEKPSSEELIQKQLNSFEAAMDDDFNTPGALGVLFGILSRINESQTAHKPSGEISVLYKSAKKILEVLGLEVETEQYLHRIAHKNVQYTLEAAEQTAENAFGTREDSPVSEDAVITLIHIRNWARTTKNWALADIIRNRLSERGIVLRDEKEATIWRQE